jgi:predicted nucleotidyltransferase
VKSKIRPSALGKARSRAQRTILEPVLSSFLAGLGPYRSRVSRIVLFGSRARGDQRPRSDYDLLMVVDREDRKLSDAMYDLVLDALLAYGILVSLKIMTRAEHGRLTRQHTPFIERIEAEGVQLA